MFLPDLPVDRLFEGPAVFPLSPLFPAQPTSDRPLPDYQLAALTDYVLHGGEFITPGSAAAHFGGPSDSEYIKRYLGCCIGERAGDPFLGHPVTRLVGALTPPAGSLWPKTVSLFRMQEVIGILMGVAQRRGECQPSVIPQVVDDVQRSVRDLLRESDHQHPAAQNWSIEIAHSLCDHASGRFWEECRQPAERSTLPRCPEVPMEKCLEWNSPMTKMVGWGAVVPEQPRRDWLADQLMKHPLVTEDLPTPSGDIAWINQGWRWLYTLRTLLGSGPVDLQAQSAGGLGWEKAAERALQVTLSGFYPKEYQDKARDIHVSVVAALASRQSQDLLESLPIGSPRRRCRV